MRQIKVAIPGITLIDTTNLIEKEVELHKQWEHREQAAERLKQLDPDLYNDLCI